MATRPYAKYLRAASAMIAGLLLGLLATILSLNSGYGFNPLRAGPWTAWPAVGGSEIDPYARAVVARSGEAPLGRDQGLAFVAQTDSSGAPLDGACDYQIVDPLPAARFWTIGLASPGGALLANPTGRYVFSSVDVLRREGGAFDIAVSRAAQPGNWLSPGETRNFVIMLRLYDTSLDVDARPDPASFPKITKLRCA
ncbi:DUF1214 domain-containing protein [Methylocystis sp. WRRC1]|uniref:DUF1214 domain-containing protein n=1 Tax=unclassified Methylocystis TaxID=2625913 RepID=UPI0001F871D9|nr:DUF1214 domain-containing protein [Methylocystis sp. ATCC 49242]MCC3244672.1 DUF1214 domain-containing protein [Methylocystis sp. WRRC1]